MLNTKGKREEGEGEEEGTTIVADVKKRIAIHKKDTKSKNLDRVDNLKTKVEYITLISSMQITAKINEIAATIKKRAGKEKGIILVGILNGAAFLTVDLARKIKNARIEFTKVSTYQKECRVAMPTIDLKLDVSKWKDSLIVVIDELIDTGHTMSFVYEHIKGRLPSSSSVISCVMFKKHKGHDTFAPDIVGFPHLPDVWLVGYGMDDNGYNRQEKMVQWKHTYVVRE